MAHDLTLRIVLEKPPEGADFGLQKGRGNDYETIQKQRSKGRDLFFECELRLKPAREEVVPTFLGPTVHGPAAQRFIYIDIGTYAGQADSEWSRRLKIPLAGITWEMIDRVVVGPGWTIETRIPGTGKDGGPTCGTVKPFMGWQLVKT